MPKFSLALSLVSMTLACPLAFTGSAQTPPWSITTVAGTGNTGNNISAGQALDATLYYPSGVAVDGDGNFYIADTRNNCVRKVTPDGAISTVAGTGTAGFTGDGGPAVSAELSLQGILTSPNGLAVDRSGNLFIADSGNFRVRKVDPNGVISTVAGVGTFGFTGDGGLATSAEITAASGLAVDLAGNLFMADTWNNRIRRVDAVTGIIDTVANGNGSGCPQQTDTFGDGCPAADAKFYDPEGVSVDASGNLYISDTGYSLIRRVDANTGIVTRVAGKGPNYPTYGGSYSGDGGPATKAGLNEPTAVAVASSGDFYIADSNNCVIRKVTAATKIISTVAGYYPSCFLRHGAFTGGFGGDGGPATGGRLWLPLDVALKPSGDLLIADNYNQRIRLAGVLPVTSTPTLNPPPGTYPGAVSVALSDSSLDAVIYYTLDGSTPTAASAIYNNTQPIKIDYSTTTVNAIALAPEEAFSSVATGTYAAHLTVDAPVISLPAGSYTSLQYAYLSDDTPNASIHYTLDGSTPTASSPLYALPIYIGGNLTLKAIATAPNLMNSAVSMAVYHVTLPGAAKPTFSPGPGKYSGSVTVMLSDVTPNAKIHYTLDGTNPTSSSPVYAGPITLTGATTIRAIATAPAYWKSLVAAAQYSVLPNAPQPDISPASGSYSVGQLITITDANPKATLRYTTDGSIPTTASRFYSGPFPLTGTGTIRAIAIATGDGVSSVASASYTVPAP